MRTPKTHRHAPLAINICNAITTFGDHVTTSTIDGENITLHVRPDSDSVKPYSVTIGKNIVTP